MEEPVPLVPAPPAYPTLKESWAALGWLVLVTTVVAIPLFVVGILAGYRASMTQLLPLLGLAAIANILTVIWLRHRAGGGRWLPLRWTAPNERLATYALLLLLVPAAMLVFSVQRYLHFPNLLTSLTKPAVVSAQAAMPAYYAWVLPLLMGVVVPITEEVIFRGVLLAGLLRNYRPWVAIGQSALLFAVAHFNPAQSLNALLLGLLLGWVYYRSHSLRLCICIHSLHNLVVVSTQLLLKTARQPVSLPGTNTDYTLLILASALVLAGCLWLLERSLRPKFQLLLNANAPDV